MFVILFLMSITSGIVTEADLLDQLVTDGQPGLSAEAARAILGLRFSSAAVARMNELAEKNRQGILSEADRAALEKFLRLGQFLNIVQAKARLSLSASGISDN